MATSNVTLLLDGLIVLAAKLNEDNGEVGILKFHPFHEFKIMITKHFPTPPDDRFELKGIQKELRLDIQPPRKITARDNTPVNRQVTPVDHLESIKWFVDLEDGVEFYKRPTAPIGAARNGFEPILKFNGGELYTAVPPNESILDVFRGLTLDAEHIGRVALKLGIEFRNATSAIFTNGAQPQPVFDSNTDPPGTNYTIEVSNNRMEHLVVSMDADLYYTAVGRNVHVEDLITFSSTSNLLHQLSELLETIQSQPKRNLEFERRLQETIDKLKANGHIDAGPEAACFPAYLSQSPLT